MPKKKQKTIKAWAIVDKNEKFFMSIWIPWAKVFSCMIFENRESAKKLMKDKTYSKIGKIIEIKILK